MAGYAVEEPAVVRDNQGRAREVQKGFFQGPEGFHVQIVGRLIQQQHVAALFQQLGQVQAVALTTGQVANPLLLVAALEVEAANVGSRRRLVVAHLDDIVAVREFLPDGFAAVQISHLVHVGQFHGFADGDVARIRFVETGDHLEQGGFTGTVAADDAHDGTGRYAEGHVFIQQSVTEGLADTVHLDHLVAQPWTRRNVEFVGFVALLEFLGAHLLKAGQTSLALRLAPFRVAAHPLQFLLDGFLVRGFLLGFHLQTLFLVLQPLAVVAFKRNAMATVQFQDPASDVVQEVAVVGDGDHGSFVIVQEAFKPGHGFGIQVVGGFVQQQHVRPRQEQAAQGYPAALTTGKNADFLIPRWKAQCIGRNFHLAFNVVAIGGLDVGFQFALLLGQCVEVGVRFGIGGVHLVQFGQCVMNAGNRLVDDLLDRFVLVQLRLLGQISHVDAGLRAGFTDVILIHARHNAEQGRFTGTVEAQYADLGAGEEA